MKRNKLRIFYKKEYKKQAVFLLSFLVTVIVLQAVTIGYLASNSWKNYQTINCQDETGRHN